MWRQWDLLRCQIQKLRESLSLSEAEAITTRVRTATGIIMGMGTDITIRIIPATPSGLTIQPDPLITTIREVPMGIAGRTITAGIDTSVSSATTVIVMVAGIIITIGKTKRELEGQPAIVPASL